MNGKNSTEVTEETTTATTSAEEVAAAEEVAEQETTKEEDAPKETTKETTKEEDAPGEGMGGQIDKGRYWQAVLYPENMVEGWEDKIGDILEVPYAYCIHDKDVDSEGELRIEHAHAIAVFPNTTTRKHALAVFSLLNAPGKRAVNTVKACVNIRHCFDYLIHDTKTARKQGKHLYDVSERHTGNGFDIGLYEQLSQADKQEMLKELVGYIMSEEITNFADFLAGAMTDFVARDSRYWEVIVGYNSMLERVTKGVYLRYESTHLHPVERVQADKDAAAADRAREGRFSYEDEHDDEDAPLEEEGVAGDAAPAVVELEPLPEYGPDEQTLERPAPDPKPRKRRRRRKS